MQRFASTPSSLCHLLIIIYIYTKERKNHTHYSYFSNDEWAPLWIEKKALPLCRNFASKINANENNLVKKKNRNAEKLLITAISWTCRSLRNRHACISANDNGNISNHYYIIFSHMHFRATNDCQLRANWTRCGREVWVLCMLRCAGVFIESISPANCVC